MIPIVHPEIEAYAEAHTTAPAEHLMALAAETERSLPAPQMMVGPLEGRFLEMLIFTSGARSVLEIGTFSGYSALSMAAAMPPDGRIVTCDVDPRAVEVARRFVGASPHAGKVDIRFGPALDTVAQLEGPFDLVFIDADKTAYVDYYEASLPKLSPRGLIVADNTLWSGRVVEGDDADERTRALMELNDRLRSDPRLVCVLLTVRDGITLVRRAPAA